MKQKQKQDSNISSLLQLFKDPEMRTEQFLLVIFFITMVIGVIMSFFCLKENELIINDEINKFKQDFFVFFCQQRTQRNHKYLQKDSFLKKSLVQVEDHMILIVNLQDKNDPDSNFTLEEWHFEIQRGRLEKKFDSQFFKNQILLTFRSIQTIMNLLPSIEIIQLLKRTKTSSHKIDLKIRWEVENLKKNLNGEFIFEPILTTTQQNCSKAKISVYYQKDISDLKNYAKPRFNHIINYQNHLFSTNQVIQNISKNSQHSMKISDIENMDLPEQKKINPNEQLPFDFSSKDPFENEKLNLNLDPLLEKEEEDFNILELYHDFCPKIKFTKFGIKQEKNEPIFNWNQQKNQKENSIQISDNFFGDYVPKKQESIYEKKQLFNSKFNENIFIELEDIWKNYGEIEEFSKKIIEQNETNF
ncbi:hypothetical protein M0811_10458 [Anaeramoeba ignava]|uniref:Autophagy-related protein 13 N-terminal domain-containing protein n=1 Tax=Anaeramoeba ignava TaxID=1746090 RepID=A0A9Q0R8X3_ANAIG|nr:hypothetical protein M0811_10458 [Anaeramoeba ignava]